MTIYPKGQYNICAGTIDLASAPDIRIMLVDSAYVYDDSDEFLDDAAGADDLVDHEHTGSPSRGPLVNEALTQISAGAKFDADDTTLSAVSAGAANIGHAVIYEHNAADTAAKLIGLFTFAAPLTASGIDITIAWNASGIFTTQNG